MNRITSWFRNVVLAGVVVNLGFAVPGIFWPGRVLTLFGAPAVNHEVWPAFAFLLLLLLSLFYIPPALQPRQHRAAAGLTVFARLAGVWFFLVLHPDYRLAGFIDLFFAVTQGALLVLVLFSPGTPQPSNPPSPTPAS